jgi:hypothetical protein
MRRCASVCSSASSSWRTAAATCRTCAGMYAVDVGLNQWAVQRLKGLCEKLPTKWEKRYARHRPALQFQVELGRDASTSGRGRRLRCAPVQLNKKRHEADLLRCVCRCQRGEYVFALHVEIDRFFWHAREPFDDAQLTAISNALRGEQLRRPPTPSTATPCSLRSRPPDARAPAPFRRTSAPSFAAPRLSRPAATHDAVVARHRRHCRGRFAVCPASPGPQPSRLDARASAVQRHRRDRAEALAAKSAVELAASVRARESEP